MRTVRFDDKPEVIQYNNDGTYYYNTDIQQVEVTDEQSEKTTTQWEALQYVIHNPLTKANIKREVILDHWDKDEQEKFINEYNAAKMGLIADEEESTKVIERYTKFLEYRTSLLAELDNDLKHFNIE